MPQKEYIDERTLTLQVDSAAAFAPIRRIGGRNGWYYANWLWRLRGFLDVLIGGPGLKPGRRHDHELEIGDQIDWWVVEALEPGRRLRLSSRMKVPGLAWLEFEVEPGVGSCRIRQTACFWPRGVLGQIYWFGLLPVHGFIFGGLLRTLGKAATQEAASSAETGLEAGWAAPTPEEIKSGSD